MTLALALLLLAPAEAAPGEENLRGWVRGPVIQLEAALHHVQGIDVEGGVLWVSSVDAKAGKGYLSMFALPEGRLLRQVEVQEGRRIHPGGIMLDGDSILVPVAEYHRGGPSSIQRRNKKTLQLVGSFSVNDHIGCVAVNGNEVVGGNWGSRILYRWTKDGRELSRTPNPQPAEYQDLKAVDGDLIGSGVVARTAGAIEWMNWQNFQVKRRVVADKTDRGVLYTHEGMAWRDGKLYLLPEDGPSRLFVFTEKAR